MIPESWSSDSGLSLVKFGVKWHHFLSAIWHTACNRIGRRSGRLAGPIGASRPAFRLRHRPIMNLMLHSRLVRPAIVSYPPRSISLPRFPLRRDWRVAARDGAGFRFHKKNPSTGGCRGRGLDEEKEFGASRSLSMNEGKNGQTQTVRQGLQVGNRRGRSRELVLIQVLLLNQALGSHHDLI